MSDSDTKPSDSNANVTPKPFNKAHAPTNMPVWTVDPEGQQSEAVSAMAQLMTPIIMFWNMAKLGELPEDLRKQLTLQFAGQWVNGCLRGARKE